MESIETKKRVLIATCITGALIIGLIFGKKLLAGAIVLFEATLKIFGL